MDRTMSSIVGLLLALTTPTGSVGDTPFKLDLCEDDRTTGWSYYCRAPEPVEENAVEDPIPAAIMAPPPEPPTPVEPKKGPATIAIEAFRAKVDEVKYRAVLDPTPENVQAYMEIQKQIGDQAGLFTDQWQRILYGTPHLNANVEYPLASAGIGVYQNQKRIEQEATLKKVAATRGILFFFDGDAACGICRVQGEVLRAMSDRYGIEVLAVSRDGSPNASFPDAVRDAGQLAAMGLTEFPAPTIALIEPNSKDVDLIGSGLLTADQILERVHLVTEVPVGERY